MSMHQIPLTRLEEAGLRAHGLDVGIPSQLSDAFRQGVKWAQRNQVGIAPQGAISTNLANLYVALESLLECPANIVEASVPKAGIDAAPTHQVVLDVSMSLTRRREALVVLKQAQPLAEVLKTLLSLQGVPMVDVNTRASSLAKAIDDFTLPTFVEPSREAHTTTGITSCAVDLHKKTAAKMFNTPESDVTEEQRRQGKASNFYSLYADPTHRPARPVCAAITIKAFDGKDD